MASGLHSISICQLKQLKSVSLHPTRHAVQNKNYMINLIDLYVLKQNNVKLSF
jgi:hypothetical protein